MGKIRRRLFLAGLLALVVALAHTPADAKKLRFRGIAVKDKKVGFLVTPEKPRGIAVASTLHHFWMLLPYSESWLLESTAEQPLQARDDRFTVTLATISSSTTDSRVYLEGVLKGLGQGSDTPVQAAELRQEEGRTILVYQTSSASDEGPWLWNYRAVAFHGGDGMECHLTVTDRPLTLPRRGTCCAGT